MFPLGPLPHRQHHNATSGLPFPDQYLRLTPDSITDVLRQRNVAQMKEQINTPEKELSNEEITILSDAEFKTQVIRMLTEMIEYGHKIKEEVKAIQSKIWENITKSEGKETRTLTKDLDQKDEINIQPEQNEETRIQKNEERLRNLQNFKCSNI